MDKYVLIEWPDIQKYMDRSWYPKHVYFDPEKNAWFVPEEFVNPEVVVEDMNGSRLEVGQYVKWHDPGIDEFEPEDQAIQLGRIYSVDNITEEIITISDDTGMVEALPSELEIIIKNDK